MAERVRFFPFSECVGRPRRGNIPDRKPVGGCRVRHRLAPTGDGGERWRGVALKRDLQGDLQRHPQRDLWAMDASGDAYDGKRDHPAGARRRPRHALSLLGAAVVAALLAGCGKEKAAEHQEAARAFPVRVATAQVRAVEEVEETIGTVIGKRRARIAAEVPGRVAALFVQVGDFVKKGGRIARLAAPELVAAVRRAEAAVARTRAELAKAKKDLQRAQRLFAKGAIAKDALERAQTRKKALAKALAEAEAALAQARAQAAKRFIRAPFAGRIARRFVQAGDFIGVGKPVVELAALGAASVEAGIPEARAGRIHAGEPARIRRLTGEEIPAHVVEVAPSVDALGFVRVRLAPEGGQHLRPGEHVKVAIVTARREKAVVVPASALVLRPNGHFVFVAEGGIAHARAVKLGVEARDWVEIRKGIHPGEAVVVDGAGFLADGARIRVLR